MRIRFALVLFGLALLAVLIWSARSLSRSPAPDIAEHDSAVASGSSATRGNIPAASGGTDVYAHNLMLRKGPSFRFYVRWLKGQMIRTQHNVNPSFDEPDSFSINIQSGVLRANIGDIGNFLNSAALGNSPLKNVKLSGDGQQIKLTGTLHKVIPVPVELRGEISALPDGRIRIHVTKLNALKLPFKALLGGFHVTLSDIVHEKNIPGVQIAGNDIFLDPQQVLPPPHMHGRLTAVRVVNPDLEEIYGDAEADVTRVEQWRNFLRLQGGTIDFGKLTMHAVDLVLIDVSNDAWFDLDIEQYQKQLVYGYTRMTPEAGLQIFMPDLANIPQNQATQNISVEWIKHRDVAPPKEVLRH